MFYEWTEISVDWQQCSTCHAYIFSAIMHAQAVTNQTDWVLCSIGTRRICHSILYVFVPQYMKSMAVMTSLWLRLEETMTWGMVTYTVLSNNLTHKMGHFRHKIMFHHHGHQSIEPYKVVSPHFHHWWSVKTYCCMVIAAVLWTRVTTQVFCSRW